MRNGVILEALAADYNVHLLVTPARQSATARNPRPEWYFRAASYPVNGKQEAAYRDLDLSGDARKILAAELASPRPFRFSYATPSTIQAVSRIFEEVSFDVIHVSRLHMLPFAEPYFNSGKAGRPLRIVIVGEAMPPRVRQLADNPEVTVVSDAVEVASYYRDADVAVAPVRGGGGTRIKILEAFSYQRPVVSTTIGTEGLDVRDGRELLIADSPAEFASAYLSLMSDPQRGRDMAARSFEWLKGRHTVERVRAVVRRHRGIGPATE